MQYDPFVMWYQESVICREATANTWLLVLDKQIRKT